jgi:segregation and condensation protein B
MEAGWIVPRGRKQTVGRPATWVTTDAFLEHFGLAGLGDLPGMEELRAAGLVGPRPVATLRETIGGDRLPDLPRAEGEEEASDDPAEPDEQGEQSAAEEAAADRTADEAEAAADRSADEDETEPEEAEPAESESDRS